MARNRDASTSVVCGDSARAWWNEVVMHMYCVSFGAASFADAISDVVTCQICVTCDVTAHGRDRHSVKLSTLAILCHFSR